MKSTTNIVNVNIFVFIIMKTDIVFCFKFETKVTVSTKAVHRSYLRPLKSYIVVYS